MTAPLIAADVDLSDFPYMPVTIARLKQSRAWLICKRKPHLAFYMLNLWMASWHGRPAASVEDDDLVLADIAMCDDKTWLKVKTDVLRGWVRCDDGRLYHPTVAAHAEEAWARKVARRNQTEGARLAKERTRLEKLDAERRAIQRLSEAQTGSVTESVSKIETCPIGERDSSEGNRSEGKGREGNRKNTKSVPDFGATDADFDLFRSAYPKDIEPDGVKRELAARLEEGAAIGDLVAGAQRYAAQVAGKEPQFVASPVRWLRDGRWKDGQASEPAASFPIVSQDSDAGRAWDAYQRARTGKPMLWHDGRATVRTEFPPALEVA